ncbi:acid methyltransferase, putative [Ixodes scapularis]|uniref:Acid methyltransferase, putative n=1 Tax=Ixodes scapularis TaxID=6945 RepID=B7QMK8_IXOSC|nr:acid methyltransferase, putative [Ixodes scapularis]|eukprot:XP_002399813.1 acid methyltransferase, putative [Ixodes scapularis]
MQNRMLLPFAKCARYLASRAVPTLVPELYIDVNAMQRAANIKALEMTTRSSFLRNPKEDQQILELGCGTGDFTRQDLLPRCQPCRRIVATDVSGEMVRFARQNFPHPQIEHDVHDLRDGASKLLKKYGEFDRVYSFFALHYAQDQASALRNVSDLLTKDGECLLVFVACIPGYDIWRRVLRMDRWKSYAEVCETLIPKSHDMKDGEARASYMLHMLESAGLKSRHCEVTTQIPSTTNLDQLFKFHVAHNQIIPLIPEDSKAEFMSDLEEVVVKFWTEKDTRDPQYHTETFVIHATKT